MMTEPQITQATENIFAELGFPPAEAESLRIRADLMTTLRSLLQTHNWPTAQAAQNLGASPETIQALLQGKIGQFRIDQLIAMLTHAGMTVRIEVLPNVA